MTRLAPLRPRANSLARLRAIAKASDGMGPAQTRQGHPGLCFPPNIRQARATLVHHRLRSPTPPSTNLPQLPMIPVRCHKCNHHTVSSSCILTRRHLLQDKVQGKVSWDRCHHTIRTVTRSRLRRCPHNITGWALTLRVPGPIHRVLACLSPHITRSKWYMCNTHGPRTLRQGLLLPHPIPVLLRFHTLIHRNSIHLRQQMPHSMADTMSPRTFPRWDRMHAPPQGQQPLQQPTHPVNMSPVPQSNDLGIRVMPPIPMNNDHTDPRGRKRGNSRTSGGSFSYAPTFGYPGPFGGPGPTSPIENGASPVGPRLNSAMRRTSGTSNGSRTPGDEASSVTVRGFYNLIASQHMSDSQ
jgi:hypothetical protein